MPWLYTSWTNECSYLSVSPVVGNRRDRKAGEGEARPSSPRGGGPQLRGSEQQGRERESGKEKRRYCPGFLNNRPINRLPINR